MIGLQECGPAPPRAAAPSSAATTGGGGSSTPSGGRTRERTAQAVEYYNSHVHRAWANAGLARSSFNDRHRSTTATAAPNASSGSSASASRRPVHHYLPPDNLHRSNSSLELLDHGGRPPSHAVLAPTLRREYGSHGSIDVIERPSGGTTSESFFAMLQDYQPAVLGAISADQRSPGPSEYLRGKVVEDDDHTEYYHLMTPQSPKSRVKLSRFWGVNTSSSSSSGNSGSNHNHSNALKHQKQAMDDSMIHTSSTSCVVYSAEAEEIARRRAFSHYDCQSLTTNLNYAVRLRRLLAKRRNTTTGASAASMLARSNTPEGSENCGDEDLGDGQSNDLVQSCPFFRNEIGGEEERIVSLTRLQSSLHSGGRKPLHRPPLAYGVAVLEFPPGETHWRHSTCPYQRLPRPIESVDQGALYYRKYFVGEDHQNWFGMDDQLGPVAISIRREKVIHPDSQSSSSIMQNQYRLVIRTSELQTLRGTILEDAIPSIKASSTSKTLNIKEVLEYVAPEIQLSFLRLGKEAKEGTVDQLLKVDEQGLNNYYKVGVMYCKAGQSSEEEMYNNEDAGPAFAEFLETIGKTVRLNGFNKYRAGLDNKTDSTGLESVYSQYQDCEIMFHVSTMLPFTPNNRQQLLRKRHIGNDIVTIVFQEPGALPFTPKGIRSQFQHVFIIVQVINPCTENTHYKVSVSRSKDVQVFGPPIKEGGIFPKGKAFVEFLLAKVVNAENAAHRSEKFVTMATRTRQEYLRELVTDYSTNVPVETSQKFSIFSSSKKKDKIRPRFIPDACQRGAILWQVLLDDSGQSQQIECFLGISADTLVLIEENSKQIVFVTPCKSILGWSSQTNGLRIYHHQGECMTIHMRDAHGDRDELMEIMDRLKSVTNGVLAKELPLKRNIMGQLGFHVQPDGIVTLVESAGEAWHGGLRQNSRLVEICKVAVSTLTYDQMVDLLKTSHLVTLTVIPPLPDGSPRKGCTLQNCKYNEGNYEGDYENLGSDDPKNRKAPQMQQAVPGNHRRVYERSFSPPKSSNSSGYGTGSSSKSFLNLSSLNNHAGEAGGTMTSSSSGHSSDDKWYEVFPPTSSDNPEVPPTLPQKQPKVIAPSSNNTFPSTPKRNINNLINSSSSSNINGHYNNNNNGAIQPPPHQIMHHSKVQISHSLPLHHVNYAQPLSAAISSSDYDYTNKYDKNNVLKQQQQQERSQQQQQSDYFRIPDSHSDSSISERMFPLGSEDDLSSLNQAGNNSGNTSPRGARRANKHATPTSRNQSPRSMSGEAAAKLRPGVTPRSSANRNSANLSSSTFQEELLRLINPDTIEATDPKISPHHKTQQQQQQQPPEVILTMARPATVISNASTTSSPLPLEFRTSSSSNNEMGPSSKSVVPLEEFPVAEDWPSLVDTATRVLMQVASDNLGKRDDRKWDDEPVDASITSSISSSTSVPELQSHVSELEVNLKRETRRRLSLENEVRMLKEENRKLKDQAQSAVHQLRKFTEWFFRNVQRQ